MAQFHSMTSADFQQAVAEGRQFLMRKYLQFGQYSTPRVVSAEVAAKKARVRVWDGWCPYDFAVVE